MLRLGPEGRHGHLQLEKDWAEHSGKSSLATTEIFVNYQSVSVGVKSLNFIIEYVNLQLILMKIRKYVFHLNWKRKFGLFD